MTASLTSRPVPDLDHVPHVTGTPPGESFRSNLLAYRSWDGSGRSWYETRPHIKSRLTVVHTNGANHEGSTQSAINWGNANRNNTKPHWAVNDGLATRLVPSDRRAIGNSTPRAKEIEGDVTDCSFWSLVIETRDSGMLADPGVSDFLGDDAELIARIVAYESLIPGREHPVDVPAQWTAPGGGCVTHTAPFPGVYSLFPWKICPGDKKKQATFDRIIPRAKQLRKKWEKQIRNGFKPTNPNPNPGGSTVQIKQFDFHEPTVVVDTREGIGLSGRLRAGQPTRIPVAMAQAAVIRVEAINPDEESGFIVYSLDGLFNTECAIVNWGSGDFVGTDAQPVGCPDGHLWLRSTCDVQLRVVTSAHEVVVDI